ncbi:MAG: hypothetical protein DBY45_07410 [Clostridiales bacterium]|nr:MAG: hypothetical protein DBY45_07410 [Clostridiales bacterium]
MDDNNQIPDMEPVNDGPQENPAEESAQWSRPSDYSEPQAEAFYGEPSRGAQSEPKNGDFSGNTFHNYDNTPISKPKIRRVGTVTLGIVLIVVGALLIWALFEPTFSVATIAKFSPAILILVGIEMIVGYFRSDGNKVKYDFLSMFVCFLLIIGSIIGTMVPTVFRATVGWAQIEERLDDDIEDSIYETTKDLKTIDSIHVNVYRYAGWNRIEGDFSKVPTYEEIRDGKDYNVNLHVNLRGGYADKAAFTASCKEILDLVKVLEIPLEHVSFNFDGDKYYGSMDLNGPYNLELTAAEMEEKVRFEQVEAAEDDTYEESYDGDGSYEDAG